MSGTDPASGPNPSGPDATMVEAAVVGEGTRHALRVVMGEFASVVAVLAVRHQERTYAATVNSLVSLSLEPTLVGVSLRTGGQLADVLSHADSWAVSLLGADQQEGAAALASRAVERDEAFGGLAWQPAAQADGAPLVEGALAWIQCRAAQFHRVGDHTLFVGEVVAAAVNSRHPAALTFFRGRFGELRS